jgi:hypothetical protein
MRLRCCLLSVRNRIHFGCGRSPTPILSFVEDSLAAGARQSRVDRDSNFGVTGRAMCRNGCYTVSQRKPRPSWDVADAGDPQAV